MTPDQVIWEYRQLLAWEQEKYTGKSYQENNNNVVEDPDYENWQKSIGVNHAKP